MTKHRGNQVIRIRRDDDDDDAVRKPRRPHRPMIRQRGERPKKKK